jgi:hypothetical protein
MTALHPNSTGGFDKWFSVAINGGMLAAQIDLLIVASAPTLP